MEILGRLIYFVKPIKFGQIIVCFLSILGIFNRIVDCRHRDLDNIQFQSGSAGGAGAQKHSAQLSSSAAAAAAAASSTSDRMNHDDGKC